MKKPASVTSVSQHWEQKGLSTAVPGRPFTEGPWEAERRRQRLSPWLSSGEEGTIWPFKERRSQNTESGILWKPMLQRRLVVLPPLLAAVLASVAGVGRDSSDYGGEYSPACRPICPPFPSSTYLTLRTHLRGRNICFKFGACCLCAAACDLSQCGDACCCVTQGRIVSEKQRFLWPMPLQDRPL